MPFYISAYKSIQDVIWFEGLVQPPKEIQNRILLCSKVLDGINIYKNWISSQDSFDTETYEVGSGYTDNGSPLGYTHLTGESSFSKEHIKQLNSWIDYVVGMGYSLEIGNV
jgi:hypothetical protein